MVAMRLRNRGVQMRTGRARRASNLARYTAFAGIALAGVFMVLAMALGAAGVAAWNYFSADLPSLNSVEAQQFETTRIYDRNWNLLYEVSDPLTGYRNYMSLAEITDEGRNQYLVNATIAAEDRTFWRNYGVEPLAIVRGAIINISGQVAG
jgi:membrane peptidoglycan carboxypeptidase